MLHLIVEFVIFNIVYDLEEIKYSQKKEAFWFIVTGFDIVE